MNITLDKILTKLNKDEYDIVYEDKDSLVLFPHTEKAAAYLSYNTAWPTNNGVFSLNTEKRHIQNNFTGVHEFIEIKKSDTDVKFAYNFNGGDISDIYGKYGLFSDETIKRDDKSEYIIEYLIKNYIKKGSKGDLKFQAYPLTTFYGLKKVGGSLNLNRSMLTSLENITYVDQTIVLSCSSIESLGNLKYVGGWIYLFDTQIKSLNNLEYVGGKIHINRSYLSNYDLKELEKVYPQFKDKFST